MRVLTWPMPQDGETAETYQQRVRVTLRDGSSVAPTAATAQLVVDYCDLLGMPLAVEVGSYTVAS